MKVKDRAQALQALYDQARTDVAPLGLNIALASTGLIEIAGRFEFDYLILDQEHTVLGDNTHMLATLACAADLTGIPWFVKVSKPEHLRVRDAMDSGAWGVMLPHIRTAKQLKDLMYEIQMPPVGRRGVCSLSRATWHMGRTKYSSGRRPVIEYRDWVTHHMCVIPTIESVEGIQNIDEILAVPGYQIVHLGLEDIWMSMTGGNDMPAALATVKMLAQKVRDAGKIAMVFGEVEEGREQIPSSMVYVAEVWCLAHGMIEALKTHGRRRPPQS